MIRQLSTGKTLSSEQELCEGRTPRRNYTSGGDVSLPIYNQRYLLYKSYLLDRIALFNRELSKTYSLRRVQGPELISKDTPMSSYYIDKFPASLYQVGSKGETSHVLRPACCPHALALWSSNPHVPSKQIIHQVASCYRLEKSGQCRSMRRVNHFTMPDYHMLIKEQDIVPVFQRIHGLMVQFIKDLGVSPQRMVQVYRTPAGQIPYPFEQSTIPRVDQRIWWDQEVLEPQSRPYYVVKYQRSYTGGLSPMQLCTIQLDRFLPSIYGIKDRVLVHFSMGSIPRLIALMDMEKTLPLLGVLIRDLEGDQNDLIETLEPYARLVIDRRGTGTSGLAKTLSGTDEQIQTYPLVVLRGARQRSRNMVKLIDRSDRSQSLLTLQGLRVQLSKRIIVNNQTTYHLKGPLV